jgi:hypothetical protein
MNNEIATGRVRVYPSDQKELNKRRKKLGRKAAIADVVRKLLEGAQ